MGWKFAIPATIRNVSTLTTFGLGHIGRTWKTPSRRGGSYLQLETIIT
jgi:hypothetical protein